MRLDRRLRPFSIQSFDPSGSNPPLQRLAQLRIAFQQVQATHNCSAVDKQFASRTSAHDYAPFRNDWVASIAICSASKPLELLPTQNISRFY